MEGGDSTPRGVWASGGMFPQENILKTNALSLILEHFLYKTRLRNRPSDSNLEHLMKIAIEGTGLRNHPSDSDLEYLMKIAIEGPSISNVDFNEILDIFKIDVFCCNYAK